jgi:hypothetical protein
MRVYIHMRLHVCICDVWVCLFMCLYMYEGKVFVNDSCMHAWSSFRLVQLSQCFKLVHTRVCHCGQIRSRDMLRWSDVGLFVRKHNALTWCSQTYSAATIHKWTSLLTVYVCVCAWICNLSDYRHTLQIGSWLLWLCEYVWVRVCKAMNTHTHTHMSDPVAMDQWNSALWCGHDAEERGRHSFRAW